LLNASIIKNLNVFNATYSKKWRFKEARCKRELYNRLDPTYRKGSFLLLLPEIKAIYSYEGDDTAVMWYQDESLLVGLNSWVEQSGLKFIKAKT
jgi:N-dimethylarginine dimethylaminohydrolase